MKLFTGILVDNTTYMSELITFCEENRTRVLSCLPWLAAELAHNSGFSTMLTIIQKYGGRKLYIATKRDEFNKKLNIQLTDSEYKRIVSNTDDRGFVDLPSLWGIYLAIRRAAIIEAVVDGHTNNEIISNFGITERGLRKYKKNNLPAYNNA